MPDLPAVDPVFSSATFTYDGDGSLVMITKPNADKTIYVAGVYEEDKTGNSVTHTRVYYPAGGAMRIDGTLYFVLKDHLGSASVITDASGNTLTNGEQRYYPFGEKRTPTGTMLTDRLYTGQRDTGLGIYYYNARFYSPYINHFVSADTIVPGYTNPQNLNRYSYVTNNPLRYIDPTGHALAENEYGGGCSTSGYCPGSSNSNNNNNNNNNNSNNDDEDEDEASNSSTTTSPVLTPTTTPAPGGANNYDCFTHPYSCGTVSPPTQTSPSSGPNWYHIAAGVGLAVVALAADALIIYTLPALIEVYEATVIVDAVATGMPLAAGLIYIHVEAITLIKDGINGK